ncbi:MAG: tat (twin-arginine translocation) pathway signal sequence [Bacteroides sp. SM23_62_1]|nr:MAG: tat (twin-arginine translocation) pathway signal sequence [Bacteroides sp. SM23_62_1]
MKRRDFIKNGIGAGIIGGSAMALGSYNKIFGGTSAEQSYDLVAVRGGDPATMFDKAILSLGGIKSYVKPNQTVVIKPNIGWDGPPERGANTNPALVARIVEHCLTAGAKTVYVFDHTINEWTRTYSNSGIEKAAKDAGAKIVAGNSESYYHQVTIRNGRKLKSDKVHELILESDVFINVPILKTHGGSILTISMKNLMGTNWDRQWWHGNDLHQCIADYASEIKPTLNVVDAYRVMKRNGPRGVSLSDVVEMKSLIISEDIVAADAAAAKLIGKEPEQIGHIRIASEMGVGKSDLTGLSINRITI